jgi:hypothetical protein
MHWKMSTDLTRPLVPSMGHHDPLDGYVTCLELQTTALATRAPGPDLNGQIRGFAGMLDLENLATTDPLGLGGLLADACRVEQIARFGGSLEGGLPEALLAGALAGLRLYASQGDLRAPAERRLAFRELGLAVGLRAISGLVKESNRDPTRFSNTTHMLLARLTHFEPLGGEIESFWLAPRHRRNTLWQEHADINDVMLATRLAPDAFLAL